MIIFMRGAPPLDVQRVCVGSVGVGLHTMHGLRVLALTATVLGCCVRMRLAARATVAHATPNPTLTHMCVHERGLCCCVPCCACPRRQRGLLQGNRTMTSAETVHAACLEAHTAYQDLTYTVNASAEENGRCVLFWTASGTNRVGLFGRPATFHKSTFSGGVLCARVFGGGGGRLAATPRGCKLATGRCAPPVCAGLCPVSHGVAWCTQ